MGDNSTQKHTWPREGYRPEWLALEDAAGGRYIMVGDINVDRPTYDAVFSGLSKQWPQYDDEIEVWDEKTDETHGSLDVRIYKPTSDRIDQALPLIVFFPGGGYIAGNLDTEDGHCRAFAVKTPCLLISVNYPKAPHAKLDAIIQSGVLSVPWCRNRARELGADPTRTLVCGGSAGGFLSTQVAYHYAAKEDYASVTGCILMFPCALHFRYDGKYKDKYKAWEENGHAQVPIFGRDIAEYVWGHYAADWSSPRQFPLLADDLSQFPPSYIVAAEKDCLRDDGILLNYRLQEQDVKSKLDYYSGLPHYFHVFLALSAAREMIDKTIDGIKFVLENQRPL